MSDAETAWNEWADARAVGGSQGSIYIRHRDGTPFHSGFVAGFEEGRRTALLEVIRDAEQDETLYGRSHPTWLAWLRARAAGLDTPGTENT